MDRTRLEFRWYAPPDEDIRMMREEIVGHHPLHSHDDFIELVYIESGRGEQSINGKSERIEKGDLFLFNANVAHSFTADEDAPLVVCNCLFLPTTIGLSGEDCRDFLDVAWRFLFYSTDSAKSEIEYMKLSGLALSEIEETLAYMTREYVKKENGYLQILKAELTKLLILLFRRFSSATPQHQKRYFHSLIVEDALSYLKEHFGESVTSETLARRAYLSVSYFRELFHQFTGKTVVAALQEIRVENACRLLQEGELSVTEVAQRVGYSDIKFFYQIFRKETALTPGEYRKKTSVKLPPKKE